ncbi:hypothetical protein [Cellulosimicrobium arenosum]|uniref:Uncharacterized protein n=1 Tax=Cellulosimicrobium arenosum TaxID=2708133 RepID=A0A927J262_9MICO|nr:hypothetical protein [Cellulosimicrobium arenosum]MBD8080556.1 hypothetical protein [Cellulosimicrobium arenosum]
MSIHIVFLALLVAVPAVVVAWVVGRVLRDRPSSDGPAVVTDPAAAVGARRHAGTGALVAVLVAVLVALVALPVASHTASSTLSGLAGGVAYGVAPATAGLSFLAVLALTEVTWPSPSGERRSASLVPRSVRDVAPHRLRRWTWVTALLATLTTLACGLTAEPDGRSVGYVDGLVSGASSPYPGWFYGLPLLGACLLVLAGAEACLRLVVSRPAVAGVDTQWDLGLRRLSAHRLLRGAQLTIGLTTAGMLVVAGKAATSTATNAGLNGASAGPVGVLGAVALGLGIALALTVVVVALLPGTPAGTRRGVARAEPASAGGTGADGDITRAR